MQNLKIRVNSEAEAEEVKRLAVKAGYTLDDLFGKKWSAEFCYLVLCEDMSAGFGNEIMADGDKPLSIGELRDMVVLKRNDVGDANYKCTMGQEYFVSSNNEFYFHNGNYWKESFIKSIQYLKPIEKNMKEYLMPSRNYEYILTDAREGLEPHAKDWIEVPEGAIRARFYPHDPDELEFENSNHQWWHDENNEWIRYENYSNTLDHSRAVWQREQDEPFLTPESTLNDQYSEIEQVRQALKDNVNHPSHYTQGKVECVDAIESATVGKSGIEAVCVANVIKYLWRYEDKGGLESILKAKWYLDKLIECKK